MTTREKELSQAIEKAALPVADYRVYRALMGRADWNTAVIPVRFQPRSLAELAELSKLSVATVKRTLRHLQRHGWIERHRYITDAGIGGRGHPTRYRLDVGADCDCAPDRPEPVSDAERAKRYRQRKKAAHGSVTDTPDKAAHIVVTHDGKAAQIDVTTGEKLAQIDVTNRLTSRDEDAGQTAFCAEEGRDEGDREREGLCAVCQTPLDPVLSEHGYQTHPECDEAEEAPGWPAPAEGQFFGTLAEMNRSTDASHGRAA
jgi:DNA-binding Lrp family transcriptional regulator